MATDALKNDPLDTARYRSMAKAFVEAYIEAHPDVSNRDLIRLTLQHVEGKANPHHIDDMIEDARRS